MDGVLSIAKDIGAEVNLQGKKVQQIETEMKGTEENVKKGNEELNQAKRSAQGSQRMLMGIFIGILAFVIILIFVIFIRR